LAVTATHGKAANRKRFATDAADRSRTTHAVGRSVGTLMGSVIRPRVIETSRSGPTGAACLWCLGQCPGSDHHDVIRAHSPGIM